MLNTLVPYHVAVRMGSAVADLAAMLGRHGLASFDGLACEGDLLRLAQSIATVVPHRDSDADGVTTISNLGSATTRSGFAGFGAAALEPHTDRSGVVHPPGLLMMSCGRPAPSGGECVLIDGKSVFDDLAESQPDAAHALSTPRSALFGGAAGHLGSIFTRTENGRVDVRLRLDELAQFSPEAARWLPVLRAAIDRHAITVRLEAGQGYILHNRRWLHGRRAFTGRRIMFRVMGNPLPRLAIPSGFRPSRQLSPSTAA
jgi:alpha-ketoglutarate-dependent taurine dioxygenase